MDINIQFNWIQLALPLLVFVVMIVVCWWGGNGTTYQSDWRQYGAETHRVTNFTCRHCGKQVRAPTAGPFEWEPIPQCCGEPMEMDC